MHPIFHEFTRSIHFTDDLRRNIYTFLYSNNCPMTADHSIKVGTEARRIAELFNADPEAAEQAGWLHDISAIFPNHERISVARELKIEVLPEEEIFPMIIHQKISKYMAQDIFKITDNDILQAVGCHTTLRAKSSLLDQVLFVADKIAWDQIGEPPYINELRENLKKSLIHGTYSYISYLWERKESLKIVHPWLREAYGELKNFV
jgi:predicted HD superfamily hydrolase involved in NAD metabolism